MWTVTWLQLRRSHGEVDTIKNNSFLLLEVYLSIIVEFPACWLVWSELSPQGEVTVRWSCHPTPSERCRHPQPHQSGWHSATGCSLSQQPTQGVHQQRSDREPREEASWHLWQCRKHQLSRQEGISWGPPSETGSRGHSSQQPGRPQITGDWSSGWGRSVEFQVEAWWERSCLLCSCFCL